MIFTIHNKAVGEYKLLDQPPTDITYRAARIIETKIRKGLDYLYYVEAENAEEAGLRLLARLTHNKLLENLNPNELEEVKQRVAEDFL